MAIKDILAGLAKKVKYAQHARFLEGYAPVFSQFGHSVYASDVVQSCIDAIATECSKLKPRHIRTDNNGLVMDVKSSVNRLLRISPNPMMTTRDFLEKIIWQLYLNYNAFIYPAYSQMNGKREYTAFYPLNPSTVEFLQDEVGQLFVRLTFNSGDQYTFLYSDIIHLRKKYSMSEVMGGGSDGQPDNTAILRVLEINDTVLQGLGKAVKATLGIRGILKINTMLDDEKQAAERTRFEDAIQSGTSGFMAMDLKGDYIPLNTDPKLIDRDTMEFLQSKILNFYGVPISILSGKFTDEDYQAFYEKTLEPLIISLGQAFSKCLFTTRELDTGNEIAFYPQKLLFTNIKNKIAAADILGNRGALTNNMLLDLFGYPPYEAGNVRLQSLNYVDVNLAAQYQLLQAQAKGVAAPQEPPKGEKDGQNQTDGD
jgi:HK97 family phage portal protein